MRFARTEDLREISAVDGKPVARTTPPDQCANSDEKCKFAADLGADHVINRSTQRVTREVGKITGKRGVDIVFEHVGASTWQTSTHCLKWGGTIVTCGADSPQRGYDHVVRNTSAAVSGTSNVLQVHGPDTEEIAKLIVKVY